MGKLRLREGKQLRVNSGGGIQIKEYLNLGPRGYSWLSSSDICSHLKEQYDSEQFLTPVLH